MFNNSKYSTWYFQIVESARGRTADPLLHEKHHILPKSMGGNLAASNLVALTFREHFICHWLLTKMCDNPKHRQKMHYAFWRVSVKRNYMSSVGYAAARSRIREIQSGMKRSPESVAKMKESLRRKFAEDPDYRQRVASSTKSAMARSDVKAKITGPKSDAHKKALSEAARKRPAMIWVINTSTSETTKIQATKAIPDGWVRGRSLSTEVSGIV